MALQPEAKAHGGRGGGNDYSSAKDAKHLLDSIGEDVYKKAKNKALEHGKVLQGFWSLATYPKDRNPKKSTPSNPCELDYRYHTNVTSTVIDPCKHKSEKRFSKERGAECDNNKISGSNSGKGKDTEGGACAPFRRLSVCDRNLEQIETDNITTHNLLVDVCMAAQFEGQSVSDYYRQYQATYGDSDFTMCTMLARSFADIGDIIRGKDLYLGYDEEKKQREKLDKNLQTIFRNIYNKLLEENEKNGQKSALQTRYGKDPNFYKLREDWWNANRAKVWYAITCGAGRNDKYFRPTCSKGTTATHEKCRCAINDVPTFFDYVPQFLRWFEEWAEDFCRKRKKKLTDAIKNCRYDKNGEEIYCDLSGYDCKETAKGKKMYKYDHDCMQCYSSCTPFGPWIDNQQKEFLKQKEKYTKEMQKYTNGTNERSNEKINNLYVGDFYKKLKIDYEPVNTFLQKLSQEKICKDPPTVRKLKAPAVNFTEGDDGKIFSSTEYCQPCPLCGLESNHPPWKAKKEDCENNAMENHDDKVGTEIELLVKNEAGKTMVEKLSSLCKTSTEKNIQKWKCYYDENKDQNFDGGDKDYCVLQNNNTNTTQQEIESFNSLFWRWVHQMLNDSMEWRKEHSQCINNKQANNCIGGCKKTCECFAKWVEQKEKEWKQVKQHYDEQPDFGEVDRYTILEWLLKNDYFPKIKAPYENVVFVKEIEKIIEKFKTEERTKATKDNNSINQLLQQEKQHAENCVKHNKQDDCPQDTSSLGRSDNQEEQTPAVKPNVFTDEKGKQPEFKDLEPDVDHVDDEDDENAEENEDEDDNVFEEGEGGEHTESDVCKMVETLLNAHAGQDNIESCKKKYDRNWDCNYGSFNEQNKGACMPPRRISLCLHYLSQLSDKTQKGLRDAFIKTAAAETFLLWQKYKEDKEKVKASGARTTDVDAKLKEGTIPEDFKRQMFYTFGDYRDIFFDTDISRKVSYVLQTKNKIDEIFPTSDQKNETKRLKWWEDHGPDIWKGMLCALQKAGGDKNKLTGTQSIYAYSTIKFNGDKTTNLEEFAKRPQFLRWLTEWGEHFCRERKEQVDKLVQECNDCTVNANGSCQTDSPECQKCRDVCAAYQDWLKDWKDNYNIQKVKFKTDKEGYNDDPNAIQSTEAYQYLDKKLEKICKSGNTNGDCEYKCMKEMSKQASNEGNIIEIMPQSLDYPPTEINGKCDCQQAELLPNIPEVKPVQPEDACEIVKKLFDPESATGYKDWCNEKYDKKKLYPGWDCRQSTFKNTEEEGACMPPRRQILYLHKLQALSDTTTSQMELRKAFIECAAIETFFLWHKYKKDIENGVYTLPDDDEETSTEPDPQKQLDDGDIPDEFKRQMFYTFGDYRDILLGKDIGKDMSDVEIKIKGVFPNSEKPDDLSRDQWWTKYGKDIWDGMVCGLSYASEKKDTMRSQLIANSNYNDVTFIGGLNSANTKLTNFSRRPQFFRWLEEWAEEFCKKRTDKLNRIKDECRSDKYGKRYSSGDGEDCENMLRENYNVVPDLEYPGCGKSCKSYKDWINTKKKEFKKQEEKYKMEISDNKSNSDNTYDNEFYKNIKTTYHTSKQFLASLKDGSCSNNIAKDSIVDFNNTKVTFRHAKNCAPCPVFGVKRQRGDWTNVRDMTCEGKNITEQDIKNNKRGNGKVDMLVIDNSTKHFAGDLEVCRDKGIFDGIRKDQWTCGYVCGVDICDLESVKEGIDVQKNIQIRAVLKQWLENFLKDYNKINEKIVQCKKNGKESICINKCKSKCVCAEKWVEEKLKEWEKVKKRFFDQYHVNDSQVYEVKSFLSKNIFSSDVQNILDEVKDSETLQESGGCTNSASTKEQKCEKKDVITILIDRFKEKITSCKNQSDNGTHSNCDDSLEPLDSEPPDEQPEEDPDTPITQSTVPVICKDFVAPKTPEEPAAPEGEDDTDNGTQDEEEAAKPDDDNKVSPDKAEKPPAKVPEVPKKPVPEKKVTPKRQQKKRRPRQVTPSILPEMLSISAFPLSVGIAFAALSYFLLKKKTKSPVDLFSVIDIHKGDYDMPTLKSKSRYVPYRSAQYNGKKYIYMEGDESDDYTYIGDISSSDITSSESEYEELDINDIYPYQPPKYKTLIKVVLEPSKTDTTNTPNDISSDGTPTNKFTDNEWNELKNDFITNILQSEQEDVPQPDVSKELLLNTHSTMSRHNMNQKPFIMSIHDRNLHNGEELTYNINIDVSKNINVITNTTDDSKYVSNNIYSGIDLINDTLSGGNHDIYDEVLKRKENELFGTNYKKNTSNNSVAKNTNSDPIMNQLDLFHKWLDRHRNMCEQWSNKEDILNKLKEKWDNETNSDDTLPSSNKTLNTDVSIQIDMDNPKTKNEFKNMDTTPNKSTMDNILDDLKKYNEPYNYDFYKNDKPSVDDNNVHHNNKDLPTEIHIEMDVNNHKVVKEKYPIADIWNI
ncbi:erythrocyte membrane protein 1, PfEMP1, putative [Plasmodium reichenowi]|uniref:Erythrocyte membrane protein 1, PfEMP1, putative n=1 Tax=Plasmodium reichenowi TaxID=5854 RepID=A0A2P9DBM2_PLARE|nr:erythrocyte membrane protein 1, PfEMP1, putative [Plasmodium reichenowi]